MIDGVPLGDELLSALSVAHRWAGACWAVRRRCGVAPSGTRSLALQPASRDHRAASLVVDSVVLP